jgi:hypothetical protein
MEAALRPGRYISEQASLSLVNELESVAARIARADPERAVGLYETFIAGCYEKADEVDDSSGYLGMFGGSLFARWVIARQAGAEPTTSSRTGNGVPGKSAQARPHRLHPAAQDASHAPQPPGEHAR